MIDDLRISERQVLLALLTAAGEADTKALKGVGPELKKPVRDRLISLRLIETDTTARPFRHSLTDKGWAVCADLLESEPPAGSTAPQRLVYALARHIARDLARTNRLPADFFLPDAPAGPDTSLALRIRGAYTELAAKPGAWVALVRLRNALADVPRDDLDTALRELDRARDVDLIPEENQKTLTPADRAAAVVVGVDHHHLLRIAP